MINTILHWMSIHPYWTIFFILCFIGNALAIMDNDWKNDNWKNPF